MHLRATQTENEYLAGARVNEPAEETKPDHQSADSRALQSVKGGSLSPGVDAGAARSLQRMAGNAAFTTAVQRDGGGAATEYDTMDGSSVHDALKKPSEPLPTDVQRDMSRSYGMDMSGVGIIRDDSSTKAVNSEAYTANAQMVVPSDFDPSSSKGKQIVGHELTHVITQSQGNAEGTEVACGVSVSNPNDHYEQEAHANGEAVANGGFANVASAGISAASVQRQVESGTVQRMVPGEKDAQEAGIEDQVQRQDAPEEEGPEDQAEEGPAPEPEGGETAETETDEA